MFLQISALEYHWFSCVKYGVWINSTATLVFLFVAGIGVLRKDMVVTWLKTGENRLETLNGHFGFRFFGTL